MSTERSITAQPEATGGPSAKVTAHLVAFSEEAARRLGPELEARDLAWREVGSEEAASLGPELEGGRALLAVGDALDPESAARLLARVLPPPPEATMPAAPRTMPRGVSVVFAAGERSELFHPFVAADHVFYLSRELPAAAAAADVLAAAAGALARSRVRAEPASRDTAQLDEALRQLERESDTATVAGRLERELRAFLEAERVTTWFFEASSDTLWTPAGWQSDDDVRRESAAAGVVGFTLRTGRTVCAEQVGEDPRFDPEIDNDGGPPDERLLVVAVPGDPGASDPGASGAPWPFLGAIAAVRGAGESPFTEDERRRLEKVARRLRLVFERALEQRARETQPTDGALSSRAASLFRREALEHYRQGAPDHGQVLQISPAWMHRAVWVLLAAVVAALVYSLLGTVDEYAGGIAVVRSGSAHTLTAPVSGTVSGVDVTSGQSVSAGDVLVRLYGAREAAELARIRRELELGLLERLRFPTDAANAQTLSALRAQLQLAEARLEERTVRAPADGRVGDVRVRVGQLLSPGEVVLGLEGEDDAALRVIALIPGQYRPLVRLGMPLRLELRGYRYAYQHLRVDAVSAEVFGPSEARRVLGPEIADAVEVDGPVALVEARLPGPTFKSGGRVYAYHDGIPGRAEIRVRSEPILFSLVPGLEAVTEWLRQWVSPGSPPDASGEARPA